MTIGLTVTGNALLGYVLTVTDADQGDRVRVYRSDVSGHYPDAGVRGIDLVVPTGDTMIVVDYEAPFNTELHYHAQAFAISDLVTPIATATTAPIDTVLPPGFAIITDPLDANLRLAVAVNEFNSWDLDIRILGTHKILGRRNSVVNSDVQGGRSGKMTISNVEQFGVNWDGSGPYLPYTIVSHANWNTVFSAGSKLLFRATWYESGFDDLYFRVTGHGVQRPTKVGVNQGSVFLKHDISFVEEDRPSTTLAGTGLGRWEDVRVSNVNWTEVLADHATWASVLLNPDL